MIFRIPFSWIKGFDYVAEDELELSELELEDCELLELDAEELEDSDEDELDSDELLLDSELELLEADEYSTFTRSSMVNCALFLSLRLVKPKSVSS